VERKAERAVESSGRKCSGRPGTLTPGWKRREAQPSRASERSATNFNPDRERAAASLEALIRQPAKPAVGERRGEMPGSLDCAAQGRACRRWARLRLSEPEGTKRTRNDDPSVEQIKSARWRGAKGDRAYRKVSQTQVGSTGCFDPEGEIPEGSDSRIHLRMRRMDVEITGIGPLIRQTVIENGSLGGSGRTDFSRWPVWTVRSRAGALIPPRRSQ
jgi:hypothetical protein